MAVLVVCLLPATAAGYTHFVDRDASGRTVTAFWPESTQPLHFLVDKHPLVLENEGPLAWVQQALQLWGQVPGMRLQLRATMLNKDITKANFKQEVSLNDQKHEIVIDKDGEIMEELGLDPEFVAGVGIPITEANPKGSLDGPFHGKIVDALLLINTRFAWTRDRMVRLLLHELGHALGLAHSNVAHLVRFSKLPAMFYDPSRLTGPVRLQDDDKAGLLSLYPKREVEQRYGALAGVVRDGQGKPLFGAVVIASPVDDDEKPIASWSGPDGRFQIAGLVPGRYTLLLRGLDGSKSVQSMDPSKHLGGLYQQAKQSFCPEVFNDHSFFGCQAADGKQDLLHVRAGQSLVGLILQTGTGNPSPPARCVIGAVPELYGHTLLWSNEVKPWGKRGDPCPAISVEPRHESTRTEPPREGDAGEPITRERGDTAMENARQPETPPVCGCTQKNEGFPWRAACLWLAFLGLLVHSRRPRRTLGILVVLWLGSTSATMAHAMQVHRPTWSQLVQRTELVLYVKVSSNRVVVAKRGIPMVHSSFVVKKCLHGNWKQKNIVIALPAGRVGEKRLWWSGIPRFQRGTEQLLFLRRRRKSSGWLLVALYYGVFDVKKEKGQSWVSHRGGLHLPMGWLLWWKRWKRAKRPEQATSRPWRRPSKSSRRAKIKT